MLFKECPDQIAIPGPAVLRVAGRMNADVAASMLDILHKRVFLRRIEHVA
jgi:hypothetical protein